MENIQERHLKAGFFMGPVEMVASGSGLALWGNLLSLPFSVPLIPYIKKGRKVAEMV